MKKNIFISLLVVAMGVIAFIGCEKPEQIEPQTSQPEPIPIDTVNPIAQEPTDTVNPYEQEPTDTVDPFAQEPVDTTPLDLIGEWVVNPYMSQGVEDNYTDTLLFTAEGIIEKHFFLSGSQYSILNDTTLKIENTHGVYNIIFKYYPPRGIMFYHFWDNSATEVIKNIYYEKIGA